MKTNNKAIRTLSIIALISLSYSCGSKDEKQAGPQGPPTLKTYSIERQDITLYTEYPTTLQGEQDIEIRPKIDGYIDAVLVEEGQYVSKNQVLFRISNPMYQQTLRNAEAAVELAETEVGNAELQVNKTKPLVDKTIVSNYELESAKLVLKAKKAALNQARANLENARVNVGYTTIRSPFNGVVGTLPFKLGSYVSSNTQQALTVISNISKVYAYFSISEKDQLNFFRTTTGKTMDEKIRQMAPVTLLLADGQEYDQKGKVETFSGQVNTQTGSYNVRAGFPNPNKLLRSGNSGTIRIITPLEKAIVIPQNATFELQGKRFVFVVNNKQEVKAVEISVREVPGGQKYVVDSGLKEGDEIAVEGIAVLADGMKLIPKKVTTSELFATEETK